MKLRLLALVSSALVSGWSMAAPADPLEEVVVTAQKREQNLLEVPIAVQAISGAKLEESGIHQINDLLELIPGATSVSRSSPGYETISIRGISSGTTGDATVGYYIDDVPFGVPNLQLVPPSRLFDLQRVEVLRGPQGTLWGQGAMGGTIRLITASPNFEKFQGKTQAEVSSTTAGAPSYSVDGVFNAPIVQGKAGLRLSGGYEKVGGFADSVELGTKDINGVGSWNGRAKLGFTPSQNVGVELSVWRIENKQDYRNTMASVAPPVISNTGPATRPNFINTHLTLASALVNVELPIGRLTSSSGYTRHGLGFDQSYLARGILRNASVFETDGFVQEVRLASTPKGSASWIIGGYYNDSKISSDICLSLVLPCTTPSSININSVSTISTTAWALFGEASYGFFDGRVTALLGARYFQDERKRRGVNRNAPAATALRTSAGTFSTFNPRFNLSYKAAPDVMFYLNVAKGFRSGAFQTPEQAAAAVAQGIPASIAIQPDEVWSYEVGTKGRLAGGQLVFDASLYRINWSDIQLQFTIFGLAALANGGNGHSQGLDVGFTWNTPLEGLQFQLTGNINEAVYDDVVPAITTYNPRARNGGRIPSVPKHSFSFVANYGWPIASWSARGFVSASFANRAAQVDTSGLIGDELKHDIGARVGVDFARWKLQVFGKNLADERVALVVNTLGKQPNMPRQVGVRVSADF